MLSARRGSADDLFEKFEKALAIFDRQPTARQISKISHTARQLFQKESFNSVINRLWSSYAFWKYLIRDSPGSDLHNSESNVKEYLRIFEFKAVFAGIRSTRPNSGSFMDVVFFLADVEGLSRPPSFREFFAETARESGSDLGTYLRATSDERLREAIPDFVEVVESLWPIDNSNWWQSPRLCGAVRIIDEIYTSHPGLPLELFYSKCQERILEIKESLVLMRGNQEPRQMARFIHKFYNLESKAHLIGLENSIQMRHELQDAFFRTLFEGVQSTTLNLQIRRDQIVQDALSQVETKKAYELRRQLRVKFVGEDGVDEGGLQKEFFQLFLRACFNPEYGLFKYHEESRLFWFTPMLDDRMTHEATEDCYAIGKLFGLAIYNSVLLDVRFPLAFYKLLVDQTITVDDLAELEPSLGRGLKSILQMDRQTFDLSGLEGTPFEIELTSLHPSRPLRFRLPTIHTSLSFENREEFVQLYAEAILHRTVELPLQAFIRGFKFTFGKSILFQYHPREIETLLCGSQSFDYHALQHTTIYEGGFTARSPVIRWFWDIFHYQMTEAQRQKFLAFVTGTDRAPVGGLGRLEMRIVKNGPDTDRLPSAHTCFNTLLLNSYSSRDRLAYWLLMAIENCSGFGLQ